MRATERRSVSARSSEIFYPEASASQRWEDRRGLWPLGAASAARACSSMLSAILAADVADYTRHLEEDEAATHACFIAMCRGVIEPLIARYAGRTVKNTGDGFVAAFASATSAVLCAVGFQSAIRARNGRRRRGRRLQFRVGINIGDVIFELHDVFGHTVNVAARLEALAEPGGVLVSHAVRASVRDPTLCFEDVGEITLKNITETVRGFRASSRVGPKLHVR